MIEDLASGYEVRDIENAVIKCKVFEIAVPKIDEFPGVKKFCSTSGETISVAWDPPIGGIYENYEIFYKESDGTGFKYADALAGEPGYTAIDGIATGATSYDITGLTPGKSYTYGILAYVDGSVKTYSEFNSGIQTCQVPYPSPRFKEWVDVFAVGPKVDGRVPLELQADSTGKPTTLFETFNRLGQPIEVEVDSNESPTTNHADQFGNIASSAIFDGVYGKPEQDVSSTELHQYSNSGIVRIAFKDITFDNNAFSMWDLITANGDDSELKKDRQFGYRIYRSADNGLTYQDLTASSNDFQTTSNSGLLHPIDFSEKPRINEAASTFKAVSFIDYSVKSLEQASNRERARIYLYKIVPVFDGVELPFSEQEELPQNVIRVILPPANMALVHRLVANRQMCMELGKSYLDDDGEADYENNYACEWNGIGAKGKTAPYVIGETVYDFGSDMLIDRYELGCNMTRGHQGNQDSIFVGDSDEFQGLADSGQVFKGCLQSTAASNQQNSGQATPWDSHSDW
ncbi:MAG: fibronectin type III domain-containing protein, partial [Halobacteriovoraceae bacterium]|nr:fibronectin type III domain-containing protein [Halobacteriovoraceae bacterium]